MTYEVKWTGKFKKSFKLAKKRGLDLSLLQDIIEKIRTGVTLDEKNRDHEPKGKYDGFRNVIYNLIGYLFTCWKIMC